MVNWILVWRNKEVGLEMNVYEVKGSLILLIVFEIKLEVLCILEFSKLDLYIILLLK